MGDADKAAWDGYARSCARSSCYHLTVWKDVIEKSFRHKTHYLLAADESGEIRGILPLVHMKSALFGNFMVSLPYFNYGGVCVEDMEAQRLLMAAAIMTAAELGAMHLELRQHFQMDSGLRTRTSKVSMRLELRDEQDLWGRFTSKLRSQIRRPQKEGMYSKIGRMDELENFYSVFSVNMRDLGTPVYPKEFFRNILELYADSWICTVYTRDGLPAASGFLIGFRDTLEIAWASSLRDFNRWSPNMLLYWSVLSFACGRNFKVFDFGRSTPGEGTFRFKEQWGAKPAQLYWHYWMREGGPMPELNPKNPRFRTAIGMWKKMPVCLTRLIGPHIVRNLP